MANLHNKNYFSPDLDDGEHHLPSDIFLNDTTVLPHNNHLSLMEDLSTQLAALSLLKKNLRAHSHSHTSSNIIPPFASQRVKMGVDDHVRTGFLDFHGGGLVSQRNFGCRTRFDPFYELPVRPSRVERYLMEERRRQLAPPPPRVLRSLQRNHFENSRVNPFRQNGFGSSSVRESGGTGVFHPLVVNPTALPPPPFYDANKRKQSARSRQAAVAGIQTEQQQKNSMRRGVQVLKNQEDCYYHLPPEMGLPQDWTYQL